MSEVLASLKKKGGRSYGVNLFGTSITPPTNNSWTVIGFTTGTVNDPTATTSVTFLDSNFAHFNDAKTALIVDKAIPKAYLSGQAYAGRNSSGTLTYTGVRIKKNGSTIQGTSIMGSSGTSTPSFRRVQTSFAVGDSITVECNRTDTGGRVVINIVTD